MEKEVIRETAILYLLFVLATMIVGATAKRLYQIGYFKMAYYYFVLGIGVILTILILLGLLALALYIIEEEYVKRGNAQVQTPLDD